MVIIEKQIHIQTNIRKIRYESYGVTESKRLKNHTKNKKSQNRYKSQKTEAKQTQRNDNANKNCYIKQKQLKQMIKKKCAFYFANDSKK